jgi:2-methylcitrate dehydratase PrpD
MNPMPAVSVSEKLSKSFAVMPTQLPLSMRVMCDSLLIDVVGLCVAARNTDYVNAVFRATNETGECTVIGRQGRFSVGTATLVNGTATHGEDYDDTYEGGPIHAGAVIVPAVLATAEQHHLSGDDVLRGIAVGSELMCRLCTVAPKLVHKAGFHPTAVFGALGAAAGVASALRLNQTQWVNALGIAGSMASGIIEYLAEGTWTKRMHPGWAAQSGYRAARMAQEGFTGPRTLFEGDHGFFHAFANIDDGNFSELLDGIGQHWLSAEMAFKPYACGTMAHPFIDCARKLVAEGLNPSDVESIVCNTAEGIVHRLWEPLALKQNPPNGYAAKFSIPYAIAVGMLQNNAGLNDYEEHVVHNPSVRNLASKVSYVVDPNNPYPKKFTGHLRVTLKNGNVLEVSQGHFRGGKEEPMSIASLEEKFLANCEYGGWDQAEAHTALHTLRGIAHGQQINLSALAK